MDTSYDDLSAGGKFVHDHLGMAFGPWLLGGLAETLLMGAIIVMTLEYWRQYGARDSTLNRVVVGIAFILNCVKSAQTIATLWFKLVSGFGNYERAADVMPWYAIAYPMTGQVISLVAQIFFAVRLWKVVRGLRLLLVPVGGAVLVGIVAISVFTGFVYDRTTLDGLPSQILKRCLLTAGISNTLADLTLTVTMTVYFHKNKTGFRRTDSLLWRLTQLTWLSAAPPAISSLIHVATYYALVRPGSPNTDFLVFSLMTPRLYTISILYTLNSRTTLQTEVSEMTAMGLPNVHVLGSLWDRKLSTTSTSTGQSQMQTHTRSRSNTTAVPDSESYDMDSVLVITRSRSRSPSRLRDEETPLHIQPPPPVLYKDKASVFHKSN